MTIIRGKVINSREHKPNVMTAGTTPEKFQRMFDLAEAKESERLAARKWHDDTDDDAAYREYMAARAKVDALESR